MTELEFLSYQQKQLDEYEALCTRCGACCGAYDDDSCSHLALGEDGRYVCDIYEHRFGRQQTKKGKEFNCIPIRAILSQSWAGSWRCAYKKVLK